MYLISKNCNCKNITLHFIAPCVSRACRPETSRPASTCPQLRSLWQVWVLTSTKRISTKRSPKRFDSSHEVWKLITAQHLVILCHMWVSWNGGTSKSILMGSSLMFPHKPSIFGYLHFRKLPYYVSTYAAITFSNRPFRGPKWCRSMSKLTAPGWINEPLKGQPGSCPPRF